jgi:hypothetical protein
VNSGKNNMRNTGIVLYEREHGHVGPFAGNQCLMVTDHSTALSRDRWHISKFKVE